MPKIENLLKGDDASALIEELGGVCEAARICEIATSSVVAWRKMGVPRARLMYLKLKYPHLKVWDKLPAF